MAFHEMNLRNISLGILLAAAVAASMAWPHLPMHGYPRPLDRIPRSGIGLKSRDADLTELEKKWLAGADGLKRIYSFRGQLWLLAVTDGTNNRQAVHDPMYCFLGEGWEVSSKNVVPLAGGSAMCVSMTRNGQSAKALYWFYDGGAPFCSVPEFWAKSTLRRITRGRSGAEPLLFILRPVEQADTGWLESATQIAPLLIPSR